MKTTEIIRVDLKALKEQGLEIYVKFEDCADEVTGLSENKEYYEKPPRWFILSVKGANDE